MAEDAVATAEVESPGALLLAARLDAGLQSADVAQRLNWLPSYVGIIERDDYGALRNPSFARGYVKAYGKLVGVNELRLRHAFDEWQREQQLELAQRRHPRRPLHLQRTGKGVVVGLTTLGVLVAALWWQGGRDRDAAVDTVETPQATQMSVGN